jgi:hypothetical protein
VTSVGNSRADAKHPVGALGVEVAAQQGRALTHADQPMSSAGPRQAARGHGVGDAELDRRITERQLDPGAASSVAGRVGERLLQDPVGGLIGGGAKRPWRPRSVERHLQARRLMMGEQGIE